MTDILLIQPPIRDFYLTRKRTIPYGLASIAAVLIKDGFEVEIFDALACNKTKNIVLPEEMAYLRKHYCKQDISPFGLFYHYKHFGYSFQHIARIAQLSGAFMVGISSLFTAYSDTALKTAQAVKKTCPESKIVLGGHHPTAFPRQVMENPAVDFVLRGEGEVSISLLAKALKTDKTFNSIPGIVYRKADKQLFTSPTALMEDLNHYPPPALSLIKNRYYQRSGTDSVVITASRGCPLNCSYCSMGSNSKNKFRMKKISTLSNEIKIARQQLNLGLIDFEDENLAMNKKWFLALLADIRRQFSGHNPELRAMNGLFPPALDQEIIARMSASGFKTLNLSLGSASLKQIQRFKRPDVRAAFDRALNLGHKFNLNSVGYIIAGAPHQSPKDSVADLIYLAGRKVLAGISIFYPSPGSQDFQTCENLKILPSFFSLMRATALPISHTTSRIESITILRLGRILNFMKQLINLKIDLPAPTTSRSVLDPTAGRLHNGQLLLSWFFHDAGIRGLTPEGQVFEYLQAPEIIQHFIREIKKIQLQGC